MKKGYCNLWVISMLLWSSAVVVSSEKEQEVLRNRLNEKIVQQRNIIKERQKQQWFWKTAKVVGPVGVMAFGAYQLLRQAPIAPAQQETAPIVSMMQNNQPLIKEDVLKYKQASKAYGAATVWFSLAALFDPFFYPYAAANFMGSVYYGVKSLQLPFKPVVLKDITVLPPDMPY